MCDICCETKDAGTSVSDSTAPPSVMMKALGSFHFPSLRGNARSLLDCLFGSKLPLCCVFFLVS